MKSICKYPYGWKWPNVDKWPNGPPGGPKKVKTGAKFPDGRPRWPYPEGPK